MINSLRDKFDVNISIPDANKDDVGEDGDKIMITGYEANANKCKEYIEQMISDLQSLFVQEITLDCRIHPRLIGQKGRNIRKIMDDFGVEIRFPRQRDPDPSLVTISGKTEDAVYDCVDYLRNMEEEHLQDIADRHIYDRPDDSPVRTVAEPILTVGAPWQAPDLNNQDMFPTIGGSETTATPAVASAWGGRRVI
jgi:hypothetical protein